MGDLRDKVISSLYYGQSNILLAASVRISLVGSSNFQTWKTDKWEDSNIKQMAQSFCSSSSVNIYICRWFDFSYHNLVELWLWDLV